MQALDLLPSILAELDALPSLESRWVHTREPTGLLAMGSTSHSLHTQRLVLALVYAAAGIQGGCGHAHEFFCMFDKPPSAECDLSACHMRAILRLTVCAVGLDA